MGIDGKKIGAYGWNSSEEIDALIDYLNTLSLSDGVFAKLESLLKEVIDGHSVLKSELVAMKFEYRS